MIPEGEAVGVVNGSPAASFEGPTWRLLVGDCLELMRTLPDSSVDALVTDPPAGIGFMGRDWDKDKGGRVQWIAWLAERLREAHRVMKPGAHGVVWALPRTSHWTATALEEAGFEIRDVVLHVFGSGFPKSLDVSKAIDRHLGAEREVVGQRDTFTGATPAAVYGLGIATSGRVVDVTAPATDEARKWQGFGTAAKPAVEIWWLIRKKPEGSIAANVLKHGVGGLNVDACRVGTIEDTRRNAAGGDNGLSGTSTFKIRERRAEDQVERDGRWPPHLAFTHAADCTPEACGDECPVAELDRQSGFTSSAVNARPLGRRPGGFGDVGAERGDSSPNGVMHGDSGGASRFFPTFWPFGYFPKPDRGERDVGCEQLALLSAGEMTGGRKEGSAGLKNPRAGAGRTSGGRNAHPTVKAVSLMQWLIRLVTPPNGLILDPFAGSGSTLLAADRMGFRSLGIEMSPDYAEIIKARLTGDAPLLARLEMTHVDS